MSVPVVPSPATKWVISGRSARISGPVPSSCARALASLPYWYSITQSGCSSAICFATRTASLDPPAAGEETISAPHIRSSWRRSSEVFSGITQTSR